MAKAYNKLRDRASTQYCLEGIKSSFKLVWLEYTSPSNSLIGSLLKRLCCSLAWPKSLLSKTGFNPLGRDQSSFRLLAQRRQDMNERSQMQGGKNWILPKEIYANRFFRDSHWLQIWKNHLCSSMGPNGGAWLWTLVATFHLWVHPL